MPNNPMKYAPGVLCVTVMCSNICENPSDDSDSKSCFTVYHYREAKVSC